MWFKYKIIHKTLGTDKLLYLATIKDSSLRSICNMDADSLEHLFNYGQCVKTMGKDRKWNKLKNSKNVNLDLICLTRYTLQESASLNLIILCTKRYIYTNNLDVINFSFNNVKHSIYKNCAYEKYLYL